MDLPVPLQTAGGGKVFSTSLVGTPALTTRERQRINPPSERTNCTKTNSMLSSPCQSSLPTTKGKALVTQLCLTLCDPMDCRPPGSFVHGILQARILEWVAIAFSRGILLTQGSNPGLLHCRQILHRLSPSQGSPSPTTKAVIKLGLQIQTWLQVRCKLLDQPCAE